MNLQDKEIDFLYARLSDLFERSNKGALSVSPFYSPSELVYAKRWITGAGVGERAVIFGGYTCAERARVYFLPDYIPADRQRTISELIEDYGFSDPTVMLKIKGSGFRAMSHRDFMGSLLSLGIERSVIGDIVCDGTALAYVFCDSGIVPYIKESLKKVANDTVTVEDASPPSESFGARKYEEIHETVASCRFDCIISAACNLSREASKKLILSGLCELNHQTLCSPDTELSPSDVFSVRGKGKYNFASCGGENRRGRLRVTLHKYI